MIILMITLFHGYWRLLCCALHFSSPIVNVSKWRGSPCRGLLDNRLWLLLGVPNCLATQRLFSWRDPEAIHLCPMLSCFNCDISRRYGPLPGHYILLSLLTSSCPCCPCDKRMRQIGRPPLMIMIVWPGSDHPPGGGIVGSIVWLPLGHL